jgi:glycosyltransferase involved in cell wall biosynthesis
MDGEKIVSVIIPTWNMGRYLGPLFDSLARSEFSSVIKEIIFVCEKSTDGSENIIQEIISKNNSGIEVRLIIPENRQGLFFARYLGAKAATGKKVFFIDSRITLPQRSANALKELVFTYPAMCANVDIDIEKNIFCLYWQRSHESIFKKTYQLNKGVFTVDNSNYDTLRIGGTCFYCSRDLFVSASEKYLTSKLHSDDTYLFKGIIKTEPFTVHPDFRINWEPRDSTKSFLKHLYIRGPGFAEYHIFTHRGWLFYAVSAGAVGLLGLLVLLFVNPLVSIAVVALALLLFALSTLAFAKSIREFFVLAPLQVGVILYYGAGALRGIYVIWKKRREIRKNLAINKNNFAS